MINLSMDHLLRKTRMDNKYELIRLIIKRIRQLINEKDKMGLINLNEKLTNVVMREIEDGKLKAEIPIEKK